MNWSSVFVFVWCYMFKHYTVIRGWNEICLFAEKYYLEYENSQLYDSKWLKIKKLKGESLVKYILGSAKLKVVDKS